MRGIHLKMLPSPQRSVRSHSPKKQEGQEAMESLQIASEEKVDSDSQSQSQPGGDDSIDECDRPPRLAHVTNWDIFFLGFSIFTHIVDVAFDIILAARYFWTEQLEYFAWTVAFILFPTLVNTVISIRMYYQDQEIDTGSGKVVDGSVRHCGGVTRVVAQRKFCCLVVLLLQLAPVLRYYDSLCYAWKSRGREKLGDENGQRYYYRKMLREDQDVALLRVFECFLEAAPQQVLQLTILLMGPQETFTLIHQIGSMISSLVSMGWAMASYHRNIRLAQRNKPNISIAGTIVQFLWHFCVTVSRILSIGVVASVSAPYTGLGCGLHWAAMSVWLVAEPHGVTEFCRNRSRPSHAPLTAKERVGSILFAAVLGVVYLFTYLNPCEGRTFLRHLFYYSLCFIENTASTVIWSFSASDVTKDKWYFKLLISLCTVPFLFGIAAMVLYYMFFHPTTKRSAKKPAPNSELC